MHYLPHTMQTDLHREDY